jgi:hypothetical protein
MTSLLLARFALLAALAGLAAGLVYLERSGSAARSRPRAGRVRD